MDRQSPKWTGKVQNGPAKSKMDRQSPRWTGKVQNGPALSSPSLSLGTFLYSIAIIIPLHYTGFPGHAESWHALSWEEYVWTFNRDMEVGNEEGGGSFWRAPGYLTLSLRCQFTTFLSSCQRHTLSVLQFPVRRATFFVREARKNMAKTLGFSSALPFPRPPSPQMLQPHQKFRSFSWSCLRKPLSLSSGLAVGSRRHRNSSQPVWKFALQCTAHHSTDQQQQNFTTNNPICEPENFSLSTISLKRGKKSTRKSAYELNYEHTVFWKLGECRCTCVLGLCLFRLIAWLRVIEK